MTDVEPSNTFLLKNPTTIQPTLPDRAAQTVKIKNIDFLSSSDEEKDKSPLSGSSICFTDNSRA